MFPHLTRRAESKRPELPRDFPPTVRSTLFIHRLLFCPANGTSSRPSNRLDGFSARSEDLRRREIGVLEGGGPPGTIGLRIISARFVSTIPRMLLANFHFTTLFMLLSTSRISYVNGFIANIANLLYFYCIYGLASCVSMITRREDGPLLAVMSSLIVGVLNGMSPSLKKIRSWHIIWLWRASPELGWRRRISRRILVRWGICIRLMWRRIIWGTCLISTREIF